MQETILTEWILTTPKLNSAMLPKAFNSETDYRFCFYSKEHKYAVYTLRTSEIGQRLALTWGHVSVCVYNEVKGTLEHCRKSLTLFFFKKTCISFVFNDSFDL